MATKKPVQTITLQQKFDLGRYLQNNADKLAGSSLVEAAQQATRDLGFRVTAYSIENVNKLSGNRVQFDKRAKLVGPYAHLNNRLNLLFSAYIDLCKSVGATPREDVIDNMIEDQRKYG